jgi:hypothetical protein
MFFELPEMFVCPVIVMPIPQASPGHRPTDQPELAVAPEVVPDPEKKTE